MILSSCRFKRFILLLPRRQIRWTCSAYFLQPVWSRQQIHPPYIVRSRQFPIFYVVLTSKEIQEYISTSFLFDFFLPVFNSFMFWSEISCQISQIHQAELRSISTSPPLGFRLVFGFHKCWLPAKLLLNCMNCNKICLKKHFHRTEFKGSKTNSWVSFVCPGQRYFRLHLQWIWWYPTGLRYYLLLSVLAASLARLKLELYRYDPDTSPLSFEEIEVERQNLSWSSIFFHFCCILGDDHFALRPPTLCKLRYKIRGKCSSNLHNLASIFICAETTSC